jgi:hypothetical protein
MPTIRRKAWVLSKPEGPQLVPQSFLSFYCPLDGETGGGADEVLANNAAWVNKFDLGSGRPEVNLQYAATGCAVVARLLPHAAANHALMQGLADYSAWAWANDGRDYGAEGTGSTSCGRPRPGIAAKSAAFPGSTPPSWDGGFGSVIFDDCC